MRIQLGEITSFVVSSPEAAEEVMKTHDVTFANRPAFISTDILLYKSSDIGFSPYGEYWRQLRKVCTTELLSMKRILSFRTLRQEECLNMCKWIAAHQHSTIDLTERIVLTTSDIVMQASLGKKSKELEAFTSIINEASFLAAGFCIADLYPSVKKLFRLFSGTRRRTERVHKITDRLLDEILNDRKAAKDANSIKSWWMCF